MSARHRATEKRPSQRGADGELVDEQRRGIVEKALALEDLEQPVGQLHLAEDRRRGSRVGRRDDGAEGNRDGPGHLRDDQRATNATPSVVKPTATTTRDATGSQLSRRSRGEVS